MAASVFIEQGATTMPAVRKEPLAMAAPMSRTLYTTSASFSTSFRARPCSSQVFSTAASDTTKWVSTLPSSRSRASMRKPYTEPVAPVRAMIKRRFIACLLADQAASVPFFQRKRQVSSHRGTPGSMVTVRQMRANVQASA